MSMRFPRTIRFDPTDDFVFDSAARAGELAVSGAFAFADAEADQLDGKRRRAFASGMLGTESFGWSTFVAIAEVREEDYDAMVERLADHFVTAYGAPGRAEAVAAARAEAEFAAGLCSHDLNTLIVVEREFGDDGIAERFRVVSPPDGGAKLAKVWNLVEDDDAS